MSTSLRTRLRPIRAAAVACVAAVVALACADVAHAGWAWDKWIPPADAIDADVSSIVVGPQQAMFSSTEGVTLQGVYKEGMFGHWQACNQGSSLAGKARNVHRLYSSWDDSQLYAATSAGLYVSGGDCSWSLLGQGNADANKNLVGAVQVVLEKDSELWAGMQSGATWRSLDGGQTWERISNGFVNGPSETVWDFRNLSGILFAATNSGVYRLNGATWVASGDGLPPNVGVRRFGFAGLGFGGGLLYAATTSEGVYRSADLGMTWSAARTGLNSTYAKQVHDFAIVGTKMFAATSDAMYAHNNAIFAAQDLGVSWSKVLAAGPTDELAKKITKALLVRKSVPEHAVMYAGTQSNGIYTYLLYPPTNQTPPSIDYDAPLTKGELLTAQDGAWVGDAMAFAYAWKRCDKNGSNCNTINGAQSKEYVATGTDVGHTLRVRVTATNAFPGVPVWAESTATTEVLDPSDPGNPSVNEVPVNVVAPGVSPSTKLVPGQKLTGITGTWQKALTFTRTWQRCDGQGANCVEAGSGDAPLTLGPGHLGYRFRFVEKAHNGPESATAVSALTDAVGADSPPKLIKPPAIIGSTAIGATMSSTAGEWSSLDPLTFDRTWLRCDADGTGCNTIFGVTAPQYVTTAADKGKRLQLRVRATNPANQHTDALSALTPEIGVPPKPTPPKPPKPVNPTPPPSPPRCVVPRLRGKTVKTAKRKLRKAHCRVGKIKRVKTRAVRRGRVVRSSPKRGAKRVNGKRVKLYVRRR